MSRNDSEEAAFPDAASFFSEDEWKFLQDWQKDLYRNVMKEIHQALISLGPLIVTTVCSLRAKEKEELYPTENQYVSRRNGINHSPTGETMGNHDVLLKINSNEPRDPEEKKISDRYSAGFLSADIHLSQKEDKPVSLYIDHVGAEIIEDRTDSNSGFEVVSFCIKDEEETNYMDVQYSKNPESNSSPTGVYSMKRLNKRGNIKKISEKSAPFKVFQKKANTTALQHYHMGNISTSPVWSENDWELQEKLSQCESTLASPAPFKLHQASPIVERGNLIMERSDTINTFETNLINSQFPEDVTSKQQTHMTYSIEEHGKSYSLKVEQAGQSKRNATLRPYACTECDKSFFEKRYLITHRRTHSLEKPYTCTFCYKSFNRKDNMNGHIRIHTGERPYTCTTCAKNFRRKSDLNQHQRKHGPCKRAKTASLTTRPTAIKGELDRPSV